MRSCASPGNLSPDSEERRLRLLELLERAEEIFGGDNHPTFDESYRMDPDYVWVVIWQLGEFCERRAVPGLARVEQGIFELADFARGALAAIGD